MITQGDPIEFEFSSADASTAAPLVLRNAGSRASRSLAANERMILQSFVAHVVEDGTSPDADITAQIIADSDEDGDVDAGDRMAVMGGGFCSGDFCGTGGGIAGEPGIIPKVVASAAGQITITGVGVIVQV